MAAVSGTFSVRKADWELDREALRGLRRTVFIVEQRVPEDEEWDDLDPACLHTLALDRAGIPIGTGRLTPDGKIGRMAVLKEWRGTGVGSALLAFLVEDARRRGIKDCRLNAQSHALTFYARHGFEPYGEEFMEAGIPHRAMHMRL
ncbi:MAG TPA: GNAT family N-acetyltransferase [Gammaproteobacteria bacterium]|nr:GNAT family N-acetyltransferase [Gammaproteobacteria bacterium]